MTPRTATTPKDPRSWPRWVADHQFLREDLTLRIPSGLNLAGGGRLPEVRVATRLAGPASAPLVLTLGGISADRRAVSIDGDGWWQRVLGENGVDLLRTHRVLGVDWLGGSGGTTGPGNWGRPAADFPAIDTRDQARLIEAVLDELGIERLDTVLSASYGGMVALQLARRAPERVGRVLVIGCAHRPEPMAVARRWVQKQILALAGEGADGARAVAVARALAMTTYRSPAEFRERFAGPGGRESLEGYLEHQGRKFAERFDRESALRLMDSIDAHDVNPAAITAPLTLLGFDSDELCPPALLEELAARAPRAGAPRIIPTRYGHDAFLCEAEPVAAAIRDFLQGDQP